MDIPQRQGRYANLKTVLPAQRVVDRILNQWPEASVVWALHNEPDKPAHTHLVVRWPSVTRWTSLAEWLHTADGHEYAAPAQSWRRSVRYLLHLDNPEKARIPRENLQARNIDESELAQLLGSAKLLILESLILAEGLPLHQRFAFLVLERGHQPSEVSAALRCLLDLERWHDTRTCRVLNDESSALPSPDALRPAESDGPAGEDFGEDEDYTFDDELTDEFDVDLDGA